MSKLKVQDENVAILKVYGLTELFTFYVWSFFIGPRKMLSPLFLSVYAFTI